MKRPAAHVGQAQQGLRRQRPFQGHAIHVTIGSDQVRAQEIQVLLGARNGLHRRRGFGKSEGVRQPRRIDLQHLHRRWVEARGLVRHREDRTEGDAVARADGKPSTAGVPCKAKPRPDTVLRRHLGIGEIVDFFGRGLRLITHSHIDAEGGKNAVVVLYKSGMFPVPETAIEISDGNRKQVRSTHQEVLYRRAAEIRIKVQCPTAVVALQVVDLGPRRAPTNFERMPPYGAAEAGAQFEAILRPYSRELYSGADLRQLLRKYDLGDNGEAQGSE